MSKHTPEPWVIGSSNSIWANGLVQAQAMSNANAARIVACVNALEGIDNPASFVEVVKKLELDAYEKMKAQRDELLAALEGIIDFTTPEFAEKWGFGPQRHTAKNTVLKAKGGQP